MKKQYSFLKDPRALAEIRKHKWIESQKANREIGFATAAVDWINNYGQDWKHIHVKDDKEGAVFIERRRYRRFKMETFVELVKESKSFLARVVNVNIFGLLCRSPEFILPNKKMRLNLRLVSHPKETISCGAVIQRVIAVSSHEYEIFLELDCCGQRQLTLSKEHWAS